MLVQLCTDIDCCGLDGLEEHLCSASTDNETLQITRTRCDEHTCYSGLLDVYQVRLEHTFWCLKSLRPDFDDTTVRKLRGVVSTHDAPGQ